MNPSMTLLYIKYTLNDLSLTNLEELFLHATFPVTSLKQEN